MTDNNNSDAGYFLHITNIQPLENYLLLDGEMHTPNNEGLNTIRGTIRLE